MRETNWSVHVEWVVLMVTIIGGIYVLDAKFERQGERTDRLYQEFHLAMREQSEEFQTSVRAQSERSDRLYEMFIELVKERK
jgi:hypothetical protein